MTTDDASTSERVEVRASVKASAHTVFEMVRDPQMHVRIDGSGMLVAAAGSQPCSAQGDTFIMDMDREPLGDIPIGKYTVRNTVMAFEPDRRFAWSVGAVDGPPLGHVYAYDITRIDDTTCEVELSCDWSKFDPEMKARVTRWPVVPVEMLAATLERLRELAEG
jgi:hypothetical protein